MKLKTLAFMVGMASLVSSCDEDTSFVLPRGEGLEVALDNSVYTHFMFYSLSQNKVVFTAEKEAYDLAIQTSGERILFLNSALPYRIWKTGLTDMSASLNLSEATWLYDDASGEAAKSALGNWTDNEVYVLGKVDLTNQDPTTQSVNPYAKIQLKLNSGNVEVKIQLVESTDVSTFTLPSTSANHAYTWVTIGQGKSALQPPANNSYDLVFRPYTEKLMAGPDYYVPYTVQGVLTNRQGGVSSYLYPVEAGLTNDQYNTLFDEIDLADVESSLFASDANKIGYNWKKTSGDPMSGAITYVIVASKMYVVRNADGAVYKLRFNSFYKANDSGQASNKGYVSFEYEWLE